MQRLILKMFIILILSASGCSTEVCKIVNRNTESDVLVNEQDDGLISVQSVGVEEDKKDFQSHHARRQFVNVTIKSLNEYGMPVESVQYLSSDKMLMYEDKHLTIHIPIDSELEKEIVECQMDFIFKWIRLLSSNGFNVVSFSFVHDSKDRNIVFEGGHLIVHIPIDSMQNIAHAAGEREYIFDWIDMLKEQGVDVSSFSYANGLDLEAYNGHLSLPITTNSGIIVHSQDYSQSCEFTTQLKYQSVEKAGYLSVGTGLIFKGGINLSDGNGPVSRKDLFGGFSAIEVSQDGTSITAITDRGRFLIGKLEYDLQNRLVGVKKAKWNKLMLNGQNHNLEINDGILYQVESLATLNDGSFVISVEYVHDLGEDKERGALLKYNSELYKKSSFDSVSEVFFLQDNFFNYGSSEKINKNVEAITTLSDGRLLLLSEGKSDDRPIADTEWKLYHLKDSGYIRRPLAARIYNPDPDDNKWTSIRYAVEGNLRPSGATTLPNGDVVVLEVYWCGSNKSSHGHRKNDHLTEIRLRKIEKGKFIHIQDGDLIFGEELAHFGPTKSKAMDRFEGIASCSKGDKTLLYLISDDNRKKEQRTLLLMFELSEAQEDI